MTQTTQEGKEIDGYAIAVTDRSQTRKECIEKIKQVMPSDNYSVIKLFTRAIQAIQEEE